MADATIKLPTGMSQGEFEKLFATFQKQRVAAQVRDKAVRAAMKDLINSHKDEYENSIKKYMPAGA